jgi:hypothetical protein
MRRRRARRLLRKVRAVGVAAGGRLIEQLHVARVLKQLGGNALEEA